MNRFEQHIGRQIRRVLRLDTGEDYPHLSFPLAIYIMLEETSGLLISFFHDETTTMSYMTLEDLQDEHGTEWGESCLNELEPFDRLNRLIGQSIKSIKVGQFKEDKLVGDDFVVKDNQYAGVVIQTTSDSIVIYSTKDGGQLLFDKEELPKTKQNWTLQ